MKARAAGNISRNYFKSAVFFMKNNDMISLVILSGLIFFDYGTHPTQAAGLKSTPQLGNSLPLVATPIDYLTKPEVPLPASEQSSNWHRLRKRGAVRMINKEINNITPYALKPVRVEGGRADETIDEGGRLVWDNQNLLPENNGREGQKRLTVYDQFDKAFNELNEPNDSGNYRTNSQLSSMIPGNDNLTLNFSNEFGNEYINSDSLKPSSSQSFLSYIPSGVITSEESLSKNTSKNSDFPNKDRYRVSSFIGTFGIASDVTDREYSPQMDKHYSETVTNSNTNLENGDRVRSMQDQSNSHDENTHTESHEDKNSDLFINQAINSNFEEKKHMVNNDDFIFKNNFPSSDKKGQANSNSRSTGKDARDGSINLRDERTQPGESLKHSGYIKVYKTNGSHILGMRKIRPSKRARNLMFGKTKKIKPFPFSSAFRKEILSFPMKISTGENNKKELAKFYGDNNLDEVVFKSSRRDHEQNQNNSWGSTVPMSDRLSFYDDDDTKIPTLASPIYKKGLAEVKFAPTDEDLVRTGILELKEDENKMYADPAKESKLNHNNSSLNELQLAEENYIKVASDNSELEKDQDDMSIFIESKHKMTYVLPPKPVAKAYHKDNVSQFRNYSSLEIESDISSRTNRMTFLFNQPHWLVEQPIVRDSIRSSPSISVKRSFDHPVYSPRPWHQHSPVHTVSLPLRKWVLYSASVPPARWSSLVKEETNGHSVEADSEYSNAHYVEQVLRPVAFSSSSPRDSEPTYRNWAEVANTFGDDLTSHFRNKKSWHGNFHPQKHSLKKQYISQPSYYSTVYEKFPDFEEINLAPSLYRQHNPSPLALSTNGKDVNEITVPEVAEHNEHTDNLSKSRIQFATNLPFIYQHPSTLSPSLSVLPPSATAPRNLRIPTNENNELDYKLAKSYPVYIHDLYSIASQNGSLLTGSGRPSAFGEWSFDSHDYFHSSEGSPSSVEEQKTDCSGHNEAYVSHGERSHGSDETEISSAFTTTTTETTTTKKNTLYGRKFRRSGILKSYFSDATSNSENPEVSSSDETRDQDYPRYSKVPHTSFSCEGRHRGYYADPRAQCQMFHLCQRSGQRASFLCPNGTLFSQRLLTCDHWQAVDCKRSEQHYHVNEELYREPTTTTTKHSLILKKNKIRFQDEKAENIIGSAEESQSAWTHRLLPNPSLVTSDASMDSSSSSSLIPRYPGLKDLLQEKDISKKYHRRLKRKSKVIDPGIVPQPRTFRPRLLTQRWSNLTLLDKY